MRYIEGIARHQLILFPASLDDYIAADNPVRFIDAFVDSLDLAGLGFAHTSLAETGRPPQRAGVHIRRSLTRSLDGLSPSLGE